MKKGYDYLFESADQLPSEVGDVVLSFKYVQGFRTLVNKYKLHLDQAETLEDMTFHVMFGDMSASEFTAKLVSELNLAPVTAKELTDDTNTNIIEPVKKAIQDKINGMLEEYKDIELDEEPTEPTTPTFHPKSLYNEPITDDAPAVHRIAPHHETTLTHADILHGIENPHPSIGNSPVRTASGSKSYSDIMGGGKITPHEEPKKQPIIEPAPKPTPTLQQKVDLIAMKGTSISVSTPSKTENLPVKTTGNLPMDPYKETI